MYRSRLKFILFIAVLGLVTAVLAQELPEGSARVLYAVGMFVLMMSQKYFDIDHAWHRAGWARMASFSAVCAVVVYVASPLFYRFFDLPAHLEQWVRTGNF